MIDVQQTDEFRRWLGGLRDRRAVARIDARIRRLALGNPGDTKSVATGIHELRIDHGPGYRVYYMRCGAALILLLAGGDKRSQQRDIRRAETIARDLEG
jgi:putative addiction module killer protein